MEKSVVDGTGRMAAMAGALAGTSLLFTSVIFGQQPSLDLSLRVALICFAGTIPIAILALIMAYSRLDSAWFSVPFWISAIGTCGGVLATLWHADVKAAFTFGGALVLSAIFYFAFLMFAGP